MRAYYSEPSAALQGHIFATISDLSLTLTTALFSLITRDPTCDCQLPAKPSSKSVQDLAPAVQN